MKKTAINELLQGVREADACLRGDRKVAARIDRISPDSIATVWGILDFNQNAICPREWHQPRHPPELGTGAASPDWSCKSAVHGGCKTSGGYPRVCPLRVRAVFVA